jgi:hypothetical protein
VNQTLRHFAEALPEGLTGPVEPAFGLGTVEQPSSSRGTGGAAKQIGAAVAEEPASRGGQGNQPDRQLSLCGKDRGGDHHGLAGHDRQDGVERTGAKDRQIGQR